jgi:hypothetical protein
MNGWIGVALDAVFFVILVSGLIRALETGVSNPLFIKLSRQDRPIGYWISILFGVLAISWFAYRLILDSRSLM